MPDSISKQRMVDHDLLVTLNTKFDNLSADVKIMGDGLSIRVLKLEKWREEMDIYHAKIPLEEYAKLAASYKNLLANWKLITILGIPILGIIIAIMTEVLKKFFGL